MKYNILFTVDNKGLLRMFVRYAGKRFSFSIGYRVDVSKWDRDTQRCKRNTTHGEDKITAAVINRDIQRYENTVNNIAKTYTEDPSFDKFKEDITSQLRKNEELTRYSFFAMYENYIEEVGKSNGWSVTSFYKHKQIYNELQDMNPGTAFADINADYLAKYKDYLLKKGLQNETILKKISILKWFLRWLVAKGLLHDMSFTAYKTKLAHSTRQVVFLTWEELMALYNHNFKFPYLSKTRDIFCFCCFTSLRYSDVCKLKKTDIEGEIMHVVTKKTNTQLDIDLNKYALSILAKYGGTEGPLVFPPISNQRMNEYIKEACRQCGINSPVTDITYSGNKKEEVQCEKWQKVGTHSGRRTFICNALMLGIPPSIVMKWTGHADYRAMKPYIDIADQAKKKAMDLFNHHE